MSGPPDSGARPLIRAPSASTNVTAESLANLSVFQPYAGLDGTIEVEIGSKLDEALDTYNDLKMWIDQNVDEVTNGHLSKLATAARKTLKQIAKRKQWDFCGTLVASMCR